MSTTLHLPDLSGRLVLIPGATGAVGEGIARAYLAAGAEVVVPTRTPEKAEQFRRLLGDEATDRLHLRVADYSTFAAAQAFAEDIVQEFGAPDDVVSSIGGWWAGAPIWDITEDDWQKVFVGLTTAHVAILRAFLPRMGEKGAFTMILGGSSFTPVPGSGIVSMEQAALVMMQRVLNAEAGMQRRVFSLVLGPVMTRQRSHGDPDWVTADQVGAVAAAASARSTVPGQEIRMRSQSDVAEALELLGASTTTAAGEDTPEDGAR